MVSNLFIFCCCCSVLLSCIQVLVTPWTTACQAPLSFTISQNLLRFMSIESVILSNIFIFSHPLLLLPSIFPSIRVFSNKLTLDTRWSKYWSFSFSISPSNEYSGLISFRTDWFDSYLHKYWWQANFLIQIEWFLSKMTLIEFKSNCSVRWSCPTLCDPMDCSVLGFPVLNQLSESAQTHVHWVSDAIQPSHPLWSTFPPAFSISQHWGPFQGVSSSHQVAKVFNCK